MSKVVQKDWQRVGTSVIYGLKDSTRRGARRPGQIVKVTKHMFVVRGAAGYRWYFCRRNDRRTGDYLNPTPWYAWPAQEAP